MTRTRPSRPTTTQTPVVSSDSKSVQELVDRHEKIEAELERLRLQNKAGMAPERPAEGAPANPAPVQPVPAARPKKSVLFLIETPHLGATYYNNPQRFFAARVVLVNLTAKPLTIKRADIVLTADGTAHKLGAIPARYQYQSFQAEGRSFSLGSMQMPEQLTVPANGSLSSWTVFTDLPGGGSIPKMELQVAAGENKLTLDVNEYSLGLLGMTIERIGPRGSLALVTIKGTLDTINAGGLVEAMDLLVARKVTRAVIRWLPKAPQVDYSLVAWLQHSAVNAGSGDQQNGNLPVFPALLRELHLSNLPGANNSQQRYNSYGRPIIVQRVHKDDIDAVTAALESAYEILPLEEIVREITEGHPLTRAAAISGGGGRLPTDKLPLLLSLSQDRDERIQRAALTALRHFGEPASIDRLVEVIRKNQGPHVDVAIRSLASSRFAKSHAALLDVLQSEKDELRVRIVRILAFYPRSIWSEPVYEFARAGDVKSRIGAAQALAQIGHPKLIDLLAAMLEEKDPQLQKEAFRQLVSRPDPRSEELALSYALKSLKSEQPDSQIYNLLGRTKDRRAIPLLLANLDKKGANRQQTIQILSQIGDETVANTLADRYPKLQNYEKYAVLQALSTLKSPRFRKFAAEALDSKDSQLVNIACQGLQGDATHDAIELLIKTLEKSTDQMTWSYTSNALGVVGTSEARAALIRVRNSADVNKRNYARSALQNMQQRSPAYQYIYQAQYMVRQKQWKQAESHFAIAIELDPQLGDAYSGRGGLHLKQDRLKEALADFEKALEIDPYSSYAITGRGICLIRNGKVAEGIKFVEDNRKNFQNEPQYAYNTACIYARAVEVYQKNAKLPDRDKKIAEYTNASLQELRRSVSMGFSDYNLMKSDPDFKSLKDNVEFQKIHSPNGVKKAVGANGGPMPVVPAVVQPGKVRIKF